MSNNQRIAIAHRVCPAKSENAVGFGDKFDMVRRNALSMMAALRGFDVQLFVLFDGCPRSYDIFFRRLATESPNVDVVIDYADHIGNKASFKWQVETLLHRTNAPLVYFSEDDYLYAPSAFSLMASLLEQPWASFATPLDHPDRYNGSFAEPSANAIRLCAGCHWRETGTTCLTFYGQKGMPRSFLEASPAVFRRHGRQRCVAWHYKTRCFFSRCDRAFARVSFLKGVFAAQSLVWSFYPADRMGAKLEKHRLCQTLVTLESSAVVGDTLLFHFNSSSIGVDFIRAARWRLRRHCRGARKISRRRTMRPRLHFMIGGINE